MACPTAIEPIAAIPSTSAALSDWVGTYDTVVAANSGLDLEMLIALFLNAKLLLPALKNGQVSEAQVDEKIRHILATALRFGWLDRPQLDPTRPCQQRRRRRPAGSRRSDCAA